MWSEMLLNYGVWGVQEGKEEVEKTSLCVQIKSFTSVCSHSMMMMINKWKVDSLRKSFVCFEESLSLSCSAYKLVWTFSGVEKGGKILLNNK
jgi:hypothetical protein